MKLYVLTRSEYAKRLGITPNAVRMKMRRGLLSGEYRFDGGKYIFKEPERPGDYIENDPLENSKMTTPKKKYNRGNHFQASYPNEAFRLRNELLMYNKIKKNFFIFHETFKINFYEGEFNFYFVPSDQAWLAKSSIINKTKTKVNNFV